MTKEEKIAKINILKAESYDLEEAQSQLKAKFDQFQQARIERKKLIDQLRQEVAEEEKANKAAPSVL